MTREIPNLYRQVEGRLNWAAIKVSWVSEWEYFFLSALNDALEYWLYRGGEE